MTDDFDDDALRRAIGSRSGGPVHTGTARQDVITRAQRTRTLRTGAIVGTTSLVVIAGLLLLPNPSDTPTEPADQPAAPIVNTTTTIAPRPTTTVPPPETATTTPTTDDPNTTTATRTPPTNAPAAPSTAPAPQPTPAPTNEPVSAPTTRPSTTTTPTVAPTTTTAAPNPSDPPFTQQYNSTGGSITVNWNGSALTLVSTGPNSGFEAEIEDQTADRIRVRFRSDNDDSRIDVRAQDGQVEYTVS